jgi:hypothetical protein
MDVALLRANLEPLHASAAVGALGDVDEEDLLDEPRPGVSLGLFRLVTEKVRLLGVAKGRC